MKFEKSDNKIMIYFEGRIDSNSTAKIAEEVGEILNGVASDSLVVFDFNDVEYISSSGLRMVLAVKKQFDDLVVSNVTLDVYDIFEMTGFTEMITVEKKYRQVSTEGLKVIGEGAMGIVYRLTPDSIVKVFKYSMTMEDLHREIDVTKKAFVAGIPTTISFDIVKADGDKFGLVFELLNSEPIAEQIAKNPEKLDEYIKMMADMMAEMQALPAPVGIFPKTEVHYLEKLEMARKYLAEDEYMTIKKYSEEEDRDVLIHGDCHIKNIMTQDGQPVLIDMETMSVGKAIYEYAELFVAYVLYEETDPGNTERFFGITKEASHKIFEGILKLNFGNRSDFEEIVKKIKVAGSVSIIAYVVGYEDDNNIERVNNALRHIRECLPGIKNFII